VLNRTLQTHRMFLSGTATTKIEGFALFALEHCSCRNHNWNFGQ